MAIAELNKKADVILPINHANDEDATYILYAGTADAGDLLKPLKIIGFGISNFLTGADALTYQVFVNGVARGVPITVSVAGSHSVLASTSFSDISQYDGMGNISWLSNVKWEVKIVVTSRPASTHNATVIFNALKE